MGKLIIIVVFMGIVWSAYWLSSALTQEIALKNWLQKREQSGWIAQAKNVKINGFPTEFNTTITKLELMDLQNQWSLKIPNIQIITPSYQYNRNDFTILFSENQSFTISNNQLTINAAALQTNLILMPYKTFDLYQFNTNLKTLTLNGNNTNWHSYIKTATINLQREHISDFIYETIIKGNQIIFMPDRENPIQDTKLMFKNFSIKAIAHFDAAWNKAAIEYEKPNLNRLIIKDMQITWNKVIFQAMGDLHIDTQGYPNGKINLRTKKWHNILKFMVNFGIINQNIRHHIQKGLSIIAQLSGKKNEIDIPLYFANGQVRIGIFPIGQVPKLRYKN